VQPVGVWVQSTSQKDDQNRWLVKHAYFQPREGARVSLYSDSHHDPGMNTLRSCLSVQTLLQTQCCRLEGYHTPWLTYS
jgi:hypothetical protein